tara:strand:+ start:4374 stop:6515 length:2142 start_codon:yes stop_codon:yes gene_type:complete
MQQSILLKVGLAIALVTLGGCTVSQNSIFRSFDLDDGKSLATDASQRVIINTKTHPTSRPGRVNPERIVCAEPSPDVASIVANTFGANFNILQKGNASISSGQSTALAQLAERTITVQLLRDQMYRACEAYANGAISGTEYSLLMSRNNDAMVTLMLGESAARMVGRQLATLTGEAGSNASASMPQISEMVEDLAGKQDEADKANKDLETAEEKKEAADENVQSMDEEKADEAKDNAEDNADDAAADKDEKQEKADDANEEVKKATKSLIEATSANTVSAGASSGGFPGGVPVINADAVNLAEHLSRMQKEYLDQGAHEHMVSACIVELGNTSRPIIPDEAIKPVEEKHSDGSSSGSRTSPITSFEFTQPDTTLKPSGNSKAKLKLKLIQQKADSLRATDFAAAVDDSEKQLRVSNRPEIEYRLDAIKELETELESIDDMEDDQAEDALATQDQEGQALRNAAWAAYSDMEYEQRNGFSSFGREGSIVRERLRTFTAIDDLENPSTLARICIKILPSILDKLGNLERDRLALNFLYDLERVREIKDAPKADTADPPGGKTGDSKLSASDYMVEYIRCDDKKGSAIEACRVEVIDALIRQTQIQVPKSDAEQVPPEGQKKPHLVELQIYDKEPLARAGWEAISAKLGNEVMKSKEPIINKETRKKNGQDAIVFVLYADPFASKQMADEFCTANVKKLKEKPLGAYCQVKEKNKE